MRSLLVVLLLIVESTLTYNDIPPNICFIKRTDNTFAKNVLRSVTADTERICQNACFNDAACAAISYNAYATPPTCLLFADQNVVQCGGQVDVFMKNDKFLTGIECDARSNITSKMGIDPCVDQLFPELTVTNGSKGICPIDSRNLIIRAVNASGDRISLDNEAMNSLEYFPSNRLWKFYYSNTGKTVYLDAVSCASTNNACGCEPLPMTDPLTYLKDFPNGVPAQTGANGLCADPNHKFAWLYGRAMSSMQTNFGPTQQITYKLTCQAGIWLLFHTSGTYMGQVVNATCYP